MAKTQRLTSNSRARKCHRCGNLNCQCLNGPTYNHPIHLAKAKIGQMTVALCGVTLERVDWTVGPTVATCQKCLKVAPRPRFVFDRDMMGMQILRRVEG